MDAIVIDKDERIKELEDKVTALEDEIAQGERDYEEIEDRALKDEAETAIHGVLDLVERTTGKLDCRLPHTPSSERALVCLFDSVGRKL